MAYIGINDPEVLTFNTLSRYHERDGRGLRHLARFL